MNKLKSIDNIKNTPITNISSISNSRNSTPINKTTNTIKFIITETVISNWEVSNIIYS